MALFDRRVEVLQGGKSSKLLFVLSLALGTLVVGCGDTCFFFSSNSGNGTIGINVDNSGTCKLVRANGMVRVVAQNMSADHSSLGSNKIQHIFVTLRSIALHPSAITDDDSPDWHELLPQHASLRSQIDLMSGTEGLSGKEPLAEPATIPAGTYRQLRLRFAANQEASGDALAGSNACGSVAFNCFVSGDGRIQPLFFARGDAVLQIASERIASGALVVLPGTTANLVLEFNISWVVSSSEGEGIRLVPKLSASASVER